MGTLVVIFSCPGMFLPVYPVYSYVNLGLVEGKGSYSP